MVDEDVWFEPKRVGYGAGLPVRWQGWALLLGYVALVGGAGARLMPRHPVLFAVVLVALTAGLIPIAAGHTRGGWRWRSGKDED